METALIIASVFFTGSFISENRNIGAFLFLLCVIALLTAAGIPLWHWVAAKYL